MKELYLAKEQDVISRQQLEEMIGQMLAQFPDLRKVLIIPPDYTICYSYAGIITQIIYSMLEQ